MSNSKLKTRPNSKSSSHKPPRKREKRAEVQFLVSPVKGSDAQAVEGFQQLAENLAVGHRPRGQLVPQDESLFRAFQANLLSLISHELRTPLTGVLNSLNALDAFDPSSAGGLSPRDLVAMAKRNAQRLYQVLVTLLDLAALESGTFHAHLRELDIGRLLRNRLDHERQWVKDSRILFDIQVEGESPILGDPNKVSRAFDLCLEVLGSHVATDARVRVQVRSSELLLSFPLREGAAETWKSLWSQSVAGFESGVSSPASAFGGVLQTEQAFLTRTEEGLGSELLLIHQIMRLHEGKFLADVRDSKLTLTLEFPRLSSEEALRAVLKSRAFDITNELGTVALVLIRIPSGKDSKRFCFDIKQNLFRATDAVYPLEERGQVALVLDDCKVKDAAVVIKRLEKSLMLTFQCGVAHCPTDDPDPAKLMDIADFRLAENLSQ